MPTSLKSPFTPARSSPHCSSSSTSTSNMSRGPFSSLSISTIAKHSPPCSPSAPATASNWPCPNAERGARRRPHASRVAAPHRVLRHLSHPGRGDRCLAGGLGRRQDEQAGLSQIQGDDCPWRRRLRLHARSRYPPLSPPPG